MVDTDQLDLSDPIVRSWYERTHVQPTLRAEKLLVSLLTPKQRKMYEKSGCFIVEGKKYRYRLRSDNRMANVDVVGKSGYVLYRLCLVTETRVPIPDLLIVQKLMLETQEDKFLSKANSFPAYRISRLLPKLPMSRWAKIKERLIEWINS